jgi:4-hydroxy-3-methylbut-2-enyl diphosphate reductase
MGVRRALNLAVEAASVNKNVYTLGSLIHNPRVLDDLNKLGIKNLNEGELPDTAALTAIEEPTVIIRAHGVPPLTETELIRQRIRVIDATCPHVKASQEKAMNLAQKGYCVFLAGEKDHAEITGIRGYVNTACYVVANPVEAEAAAVKLALAQPSAKTALIGQTTISLEEYRAIGEAIKKHFPETEIINTICSATADRQDSLRELSLVVEAIIIAGGRNSANTQRLFSLACDLGKPCWLIEAAEEIPPEIQQFSTIGLAAGASTPDSLINEIETKLKAI